MGDIVIRCPHKCHQKPIIKIVDGKTVELKPKPKMLFIASADSVGTFKVQCSGAPPKDHGASRGWYEIELNGCGGVNVREIPAQYFDLKKVPYVLEEAT